LSTTKYKKVDLKYHLIYTGLRGGVEKEGKMKTVGDRIRERREELGMTQLELAKRLGYKPNPKA
jgi:hypothetical protein